jgi:hypothetical protein
VTPLQALALVAAILCIPYPAKWLAVAALLCIGIDLLVPDHFPRRRTPDPPDTSHTDSTPR